MRTLRSFIMRKKQSAKYFDQYMIANGVMILSRKNINRMPTCEYKMCKWQSLISS